MEIEWESFFNINNEKLLHITSILKQWANVNKDYIEQDKNQDTHYWFNERANLSSFAGAIWREGGLVVEEYSAKKGSDKSSGRIDLQFIFGGEKYLCEAKHGWLYLPKIQKKDFTNEINLIHDQAKFDITKTLKASEPNSKGLAISFFVPFWDAESEFPLGSFNELRENLEKVKFDFIFVLRMKNNRLIKGSQNNEAFSSIILTGDLISNDCLDNPFP